MELDLLSSSDAGLALTLALTFNFFFFFLDSKALMFLNIFYYNAGALRNIIPLSFTT